MGAASNLFYLAVFGFLGAKHTVQAQSPSACAVSDNSDSFEMLYILISIG